MTESWYVQREDGSESAPISEKQIAHDLLARIVVSPQRVRQGKSDWCDAARARQLFEQLAESGWYVKDGEEEFGPFTEARVYDLFRNQDLSPGAKIRQSKAGEWRSARAILTQRASQQVSANQHHCVEELDGGGIRHADKKWSTEPIRHVTMVLDGLRQAAIRDCRAGERLLFQNVDGSILVTQTNYDAIGRLSRKDAGRILLNRDRGMQHVVLLGLVVLNARPIAEVSVVVCPPGTTRKQSCRYISETWPRPLVKS